MIIGVDELGNIISTGNLYDENAYEIKNVPTQSLDIDTRNYRYENGNIIDLGIKPELTKTEEEKILEELEELDKVINRATEDLYILTDTTPYKSTQEVITRKEELRAELKEIKENDIEEETESNAE